MVVSERERGLLQRANSLNIHVSQLQRQHRILASENEQLVSGRLGKAVGKRKERRRRAVSLSFDNVRQRNISFLCGIFSHLLFFFLYFHFAVSFWPAETSDGDGA